MAAFFDPTPDDIEPHEDSGDETDEIVNVFDDIPPPIDSDPTSLSGSPPSTDSSSTRSTPSPYPKGSKLAWPKKPRPRPRSESESSSASQELAWSKTNSTTSSLGSLPEQMPDADSELYSYVMVPLKSEESKADAEESEQDFLQSVRELISSSSFNPLQEEQLSALIKQRRLIDAKIIYIHERIEYLRKEFQKLETSIINHTALIHKKETTIANIHISLTQLLLMEIETINKIDREELSTITLGLEKQNTDKFSQHYLQLKNKITSEKREIYHYQLHIKNRKKELEKIARELKQLFIIHRHLIITRDTMLEKIEQIKKTSSTLLKTDLQSTTSSDSIHHEMEEWHQNAKNLSTVLEGLTKKLNDFVKTINDNEFDEKEFIDWLDKDTRVGYVEMARDKIKSEYFNLLLPFINANSHIQKIFEHLKLKQHILAKARILKTQTIELEMNNLEATLLENVTAYRKKLILLLPNCFLNPKVFEKNHDVAAARDESSVSVRVQEILIEACVGVLRKSYNDEILNKSLTMNIVDVNNDSSLPKERNELELNPGNFPQKLPDAATPIGRSSSAATSTQVVKLQAKTLPGPISFLPPPLPSPLAASPVYLPLMSPDPLVSPFSSTSSTSSTSSISSISSPPPEHSNFGSPDSSYTPNSTTFPLPGFTNFKGQFLATLPVSLSPPSLSLSPLPPPALPLGSAPLGFASSHGSNLSDLSRFGLGTGALPPLTAENAVAQPIFRTHTV